MFMPLGAHYLAINYLYLYLYVTLWHSNLRNILLGIVFYRISLNK
jgi:hypothetical protein